MIRKMLIFLFPKTMEAVFEQGRADGEKQGLHTAQCVYYILGGAIKRIDRTYRDEWAWRRIHKEDQTTMGKIAPDQWDKRFYAS